jgi:glycosyltransferase involved in cell wall biosynthesis
MSPRLLAINPVDHPGGAETTTLRLLAGLRDRGWAVTATTPGPGPLRELILVAGHDWRPLPVGGIGRGQGLAAIRSFGRARQLATEHDAVLLNGAVTGRLLAALGPSKPRVRVVLHLHDIAARVSRLWRRADVIVTASAAIARSLGTVGCPVEVVYPPVEADPPAADPPWGGGGSSGDGPVIGFVGRIEPRKGALDLALAAPSIRHLVPGARVVLVGDEPPYATDRDYTRAVLDSGALEHYPWRADAPGLMRHLDVLVLPSYREPFGTVLAEAMAVGTPVVATPVDGLPEVVGDGVCGRLVAPGDPPALAAAVVDVLERRAEMGAAARREAERFAVPRHVGAMERLLAP